MILIKNIINNQNNKVTDLRRKKVIKQILLIHLNIKRKITYNILLHKFQLQININPKTIKQNFQNIQNTNLKIIQHQLLLVVEAHIQVKQLQAHQIKNIHNLCNMLRLIILFQVKVQGKVNLVLFIRRHINQLVGYMQLKRFPNK